MTAPYLGGVQAFDHERDPVNQAREMEIFLRLQAESMRALRAGFAGLMQPDQSVMDAGISVGQPQVIGGLALPPTTMPIVAAGTAPARPLIQERPEIWDGLDTMSPGELVSRARVLGVDNAEKIPPDALKKIIAERRQDIRPEADVGAVKNILPALALIGVGGASGLTGMATHVLNAFDTAAQFVGVPKALSFREANKHKIDNWLAGLDEGVRTTIGPNDNQYAMIMSGVGDGLAYAGIGTAMFRGIGAVVDHGAELFPVIGRLAGSPIARGAIQGLGTALSLDAGTDKPWLPSADDVGKLFAGETDLRGRGEAMLALTFGNRLVNGALGAALGGLAEHYGNKQIPGRQETRSANTDLAQQAENYRYRRPATQQGNATIAEGPELGGSEPDYFFIDDAGKLGAGKKGPPPPPEGGPPTGGAPQGPPQPPAPAGPTSPFLRELTPTEQATVLPANGVAPVDDVHPWMKRGWLSEDASELSGSHPIGPPGTRVEPTSGDPSIVRIVARDAQGKPIGALTMSKTGPDAADALTVFVDPAARNQGIATQMYAEAERAGLKVTSGKAGYTEEGLGFAESRAPAPDQPTYIGPDRQLMAPTNSDGSFYVDRARGTTHPSGWRPNTPPVQPIGQAAQLERQITEVRRNPSNWITRTREEAVQALWPLRDQFAAVRNQADFLYQQGDHTGVKALEQTIRDIDDQIYTTLRSADMTRKDRLPSLFDQMRENPLSPATPSRDLVNQAGTIFRTPEGHPKLMFHGTSIPFAEIDPQKLAEGVNLVGPGFYATENPLIAGGDPLNPMEDGYAGARTATLRAQRIDLGIQLSDVQQAIDAFEAQGPQSGVSPEAYQASVSNKKFLEQAIAKLPEPAPNVRPFFITGTKFLDVSKPTSLEEGLSLIKQISEHPVAENYDFAKLAKDWKDWHPDLRQNISPITTKDLYDGIANVSSTHLSYGQVPFGMSRANEVLRDIGYDGIVYDGGIISGTSLGKHQAVAVFDPKNIVPAYISGDVLEEHAARLGIQMQKQHEVLDSPIADQLAYHSVITDADVAAAQASNNPGGFHVIRGVMDMKSTMEGLMDQIFQGSYDGLIKAYRVAIAPDGGMDIIVSSLGQITDDVVNDYTRTGLFKGMDVVDKKTGKIKTVVNIGETTAETQSEAQARRGPKFTNWTDIKRLMPSPNARHVLDAPVLYDRFKATVLGNIAELKDQAGQNAVTEWIEPLVYQNLSPQFNEFAASLGMTDPGTKAALFRYFDQRYIEDVQGLDQPLVDLVWAQDAAIEAAAAESLDSPDLHSMAGMKGYMLTTNDTGGFVLHDQLSPEKVPLVNESAVAFFLETAPADRVPNVTPASEVTPDAVPQYHDGEMHVQPAQEETDAQIIEDAIAAQEFDPDAADDEVVSHVTAPPAGGGGNGVPPINTGSGATGGWNSKGGGPTPAGGNPPVGGGGGGRIPPRPPPSGNAGQGGPPEGPSGGVPAKITKQIKRNALKRELDQDGVYRLQHRHQQQVIGQLISPMRIHFANLENDLHNAGATSLRPWAAFDRIISGMDVAHNVTFPYLDETGKLLQIIGRKSLRDGSWARMWLMEDRVNRALYARGNGFDNGDIAVMGKLDLQIIKMHNDAGENGIDMLSQLKKFVAETRANHEAKKFGPTSYPVATYPQVGFFGEVAANRGLRFEKVDPRKIVQAYIKSWGFHRHAGKAWQEAAEQWKAVRGIQVEGEPRFQALADQMLDWMDFVKQGPEPGKEVAVKIVNRVLRTMGVPITQLETRTLMQGMQGSMYQALLGWRLHVPVRDSLQPLLAAPTVGMRNLAGSYKTAASIGSKARREMMERAYGYGVTQHRMPRMEGTGMFEADAPDVQTQFNPLQTGMRAVGAGIGDIIRDATPAIVRRAGGSILSPLGLYTREGEWNRIIVGEAAHTNFMDKYEAFNIKKRIAAALGDPSLIPDADNFLGSINADSLRPAILRSIKEQLLAGNIDGPHGAVGIYMRAVADRTQFTYGGRHSPPMIRTTGARMGYALGNFASQSIAFTKEAVAYGSNTHKLRVLATIAGLTGGLELMHRKTGFNFRSFEWWQSLLFTGSPIARSAIETAVTVNAARDVITSDNPPQQSVDELMQTDPNRIFSQMIRTYNPLQGAMYTGQGLYRASESPTPYRAAARLLLTGDTQGAAKDWNRIFSNPNTAPDANIPVPQNAQQADHSQYPPVRLPGVNSYHGQDSSQQQRNIQQDMIRIQQKYQPNYTGPPEATPDTGLGKGGGAL